MRYLIALAALGLCLAGAEVHARLFRQTYGAVTPTADGGCQWNAHQDYFVPRHCDSCRYDLFSACKTGHTKSPACIHRHPLYDGYCTEYTACRYRWRDHVYKTFCGCTPLGCIYGPWRNEKCREGCFLLHHKDKKCGAGGCQSTCGSDCHLSSAGCNSCGDEMTFHGETAGYGQSAYYGDLPHVEPMGGESLGSVAAIPAGMLGGGGGMAPAMGVMPGGSAANAGSQVLPSLGIPTAPAGNATYP